MDVEELGDFIEVAVLLAVFNDLQEERRKTRQPCRFSFPLTPPPLRLPSSATAQGGLGPRSLAQPPDRGAGPHLLHRQGCVRHEHRPMADRLFPRRREISSKWVVPPTCSIKRATQIPALPSSLWGRVPFLSKEQLSAGARLLFSCDREGLKLPHSANSPTPAPGLVTAKAGGDPG